MTPSFLKSNLVEVVCCMIHWPVILESFGRRLLKETSKSFSYQAAQVAGGVLLCPPCQLSCLEVPEPLQETELWVRFAPVGVLLFLLRFVLGLGVQGKNRTVEVSCPNGRRAAPSGRYGTLRRPAAEDW